VVEQFGRKIDRRHVAQHALLERYRPQILDVAAKRHLVVRTAVEIFEQEMRQPRLGERPIIADRRGFPHVARMPHRGRCAQGG